MKRNPFIWPAIFLLGCALVVLGNVARSQSDAIINLYSEPDGSIRGEWVATLTPVVITTTPQPTQTAWVITATPSDVPTQDVFTPVPSPTHTPSPTPTEVPNKCQLQNVSGGNIRVRNLPTTSGTTTLGFVLSDQYIAPQAYYVGPTYWWWKIWWDTDVYGWTADNGEWYVDNGVCGDVPYENPF